MLQKVRQGTHPLICHPSVSRLGFWDSPQPLGSEVEDLLSTRVLPKVLNL